MDAEPAPRKRWNTPNAAILTWYAFALVGLSDVGFFWLPERMEVFFDLGQDLPLPIAWTVDLGSWLGPGGPVSLALLLTLAPAVALVALVGNRRLTTVVIALAATVATLLPVVSVVQIRGARAEWEASGLRPQDPLFGHLREMPIRERTPDDGPRLRLVLRDDTTNAESTALLRALDATPRGFSGQARWMVVELRGEGRNVDAAQTTARSHRCVESVRRE